MTTSLHHEQLSFDLTESTSQPNRIKLANKQKRMQLLLKTLDLIALANAKAGFAYQLKDQDEKYQQHKMSHKLSEKYHDIDWQTVLAAQEKLDLMAAQCLQEACFNCVAPKRDCYINKLPGDAAYRYQWGFEPKFRYAKDRLSFKKSLASDIDTVCMINRYHPEMDKE